MHKFHFQDIELNYRIEGAGQPLLFLHGFLEESGMWDELIPHFSEDAQCITVDLPGHGLSRIELAQLSLQEVSGALQQLLVELKVENPVVIGHSMGGYIALELAQLMTIMPVLLHSNFWADSENKKKDRNRVIEVVRQNASHFIQEAIPNLFADHNRESCAAPIRELMHKAKNIPSREIQLMTAAMRDRRPNYKLENATRIEIIHGENDPIIPTEKLVAELPLLQVEHSLHVIPEVGHMSIWENPAALIKLLKSVISK